MSIVEAPVDPVASNDPQISVVIPARNDAAALARTLAPLAGLEGLEVAEIIVAASGDPVGTARAARSATRLLWPPGSTRSELMNAGAAVARGRALLFLHADTFLPPSAVRAVLAALADPSVVGGAFGHRFAERHAGLALISFLNRIRYRLTHNYYGDQAIFVRAHVFHALGGYAPMALMEDVELTRRLKRLGRTVVLRERVQTSGRRFLARGCWRTLALIAWLLLLFTLRRDTERYAERWRGPASASPGSPSAR